MDKLDEMILIILEARLKHAALKHPEGPSMEALEWELDEAIEENVAGNKIRLVYELYDVMAVAWRLIEQEGIKDEESISILDDDWMPD